MTLDEFSQNNAQQSGDQKRSLADTVNNFLSLIKVNKQKSEDEKSKIKSSVTALISNIPSHDNELKAGANNPGLQNYRALFGMTSDSDVNQVTTSDIIPEKVKKEGKSQYQYERMKQLNQNEELSWLLFGDETEEEL